MNDKFEGDPFFDTSGMHTSGTSGISRASGSSGASGESVARNARLMLSSRLRRWAVESTTLKACIRADGNVVWNLHKLAVSHLMKIVRLVELVAFASSPSSC